MKEYNEFSEWFLRTFSGAYVTMHFHTYLSCYSADPLFHADLIEDGFLQAFYPVVIEFV